MRPLAAIARGLVGVVLCGIPLHAQSPADSLSAGVRALEGSLQRALSDEDRLAAAVPLAGLYARKSKATGDTHYLDQGENLLKQLAVSTTGSTQARALDAYGTFLADTGRDHEALEAYQRLDMLPAAQRNSISRRQYSSFLLNAAVVSERIGLETQAMDFMRRSLFYAPSSTAACSKAVRLALSIRERDAALKLLDQLIDYHATTCAGDMLQTLLRADAWRADVDAYPQLLTVWVRYLTDARISPEDYAREWILTPTSCGLCNQRLQAINFAMNGELKDFITNPHDAEQYATGWLVNGYARRQYARLAAVASKQYASVAGRDTTAARLLWAWNLDRRSVSNATDLLEIIAAYDMIPKWAEDALTILESLRVTELLTDDDDPLALVRFHDALGRVLLRRIERENNKAAVLMQWRTALAAYEHLDDAVRSKQHVVDLVARLATLELAQGCPDEARQHYLQASATYARLGNSPEAQSLLANAARLSTGGSSGELGRVTALVDLNANMPGPTPEAQADFVKAWIAADPEFRAATLDVHVLGNVLIVTGQVDTEIQLAALRQSISSIVGTRKIVLAVSASGPVDAVQR
jgi:hypothetical protein